jgi:type 1 glutamine amidotransferase
MKKRILVICGDQYHPSQDVMAGLAAMNDGELVFTQAPQGSVDFLTEAFDAVVLAKLNVVSADDSSPWMTTQLDDQLEALIANGVGLLVVHAGTVGYSSSPKLRRITGGSFIQHPEPCTVRLEPTNRSSVSTAPFEVWDEHYLVETDPEIEVFLESVSVHGRQPAGWLNRHQDGTICVLTPGHFAEVWQDTNFHKLLRFGVRSVLNG